MLLIGVWYQQIDLNNGHLPGTEKGNIDGSSAFIALDYRKIPGFVIASNIKNIAA